MKLTVLLLIAFATAPVESLRLRRVAAADIEPEAAEESEAAIAIIDDDSDRGEERELLSAWCDPNTPTNWHPNYAVAWSAGGCIYKADCDSPGYDTELACCDGAYGGQVSGACKAGFANPSTTTTKWYADYGTSWAVAGCKTAFPYPSYATTFFNNQLDCCKGAYGGQTSGACLAGLPNSPTMAPITAGGVGGRWYANYGVAWSIAGCKNTSPYPELRRHLLRQPAGVLQGRLRRTDKQRVPQGAPHGPHPPPHGGSHEETHICPHRGAHLEAHLRAHGEAIHYGYLHGQCYYEFRNQKARDASASGCQC